MNLSIRNLVGVVGGFLLGHANSLEAQAKSQKVLARLLMAVGDGVPVDTAIETYFQENIDLGKELAEMERDGKLGVRHQVSYMIVNKVVPMVVN